MRSPMEIRILADAGSVAQEAAALIAREARAAVAARGRFVVAFSGGHTPWQMLRILVGEDVPWKGVYVVQADERVAQAGDPDRNLTHMRESLLGACAAAARATICHAGGVSRPKSRGQALCADSPGDCRLAPGARSRSSGSWARWPHRVSSARRCGSQCYRCRRGGDRGLPGKTPDDAYVSDPQSRTACPMVGDRWREGGHAGAAPKR